MDQKGTSVLIGFALLSVALGLPLALPTVKAGSTQGRDESAQEQKEKKEGEGEEEMQDGSPPVDVWINAARVYGEFFGLRTEAPGEAALRKVFAERRIHHPNYQLEFLIALVPDPLDSQMPANFDQALEGIQKAFSDSGYLLDRVWLPWAEEKATETKIHRKAPGIVLFRKDPDVLATVLLVGESPKSGIQKEAFVNAVRLAAPSKDGERIRVVGPSFSGSMSSLRMALNLHRKKKVEKTTPSPRTARPIQFEIVSGTATAPRLRKNLADFGSSVTFCRTVISDEVLQGEALKHLTGDMGWDRKRLAFLTEADTGYGQGQQHEGTRAEFSSGTAHVRTAWEEKGLRKSSDTDQVVKAPKWALDLSLMEDRKPVDLIPRFDPLSVAESDLALTALLRTINRERLRYVGIMATDTRDKLFLAEQIHRFCPDVLLFTFENDLLYGHPEVGRAMDGMLVLSQYPLYTEGQKGLPLLGDARLLRQFSSEYQQGVFQAVRYVIGQPGGIDRSIWISAVEHGVAWPITRIAVSSDTPDWCPNVDSRVGEQPREGLQFTELAERRDLQLLFFMVALYLLASALDRIVIPLDLVVDLYRKTRHSRIYRSRGVRWSTRWLHRLGGAGKRLSRWQDLISVWHDRATLSRIYPLALGMTVLWLAGSLIVFLGLSPLLLGRTNRPEMSEIALLGLLLLYALLLLRLGLVAWPYFEEVMRRFSVTSRWVPVLIWVGMALFAAGLFVGLLYHLWMIEGGEEVFYFRARAFAGGLSPVIPLLWLGAALYAWAVLELRRLRLLVRHSPEWPFQQAWEPVLRRLPKAAAQLRNFLIDTHIPGTWRTTGFFIVLIPPLFLLWTTIQPVAEVKAYGRLFLLLCFLTLGLGAVSFYRFVSIWLLLEKILQRLEHTTLYGALDKLSPNVGWTPMRSFWQMPAFNVVQLSVKKMEDIERHLRIPMRSFKEDVKNALDEAFEARRLDPEWQRRGSRPKAAFSKEVDARRRMQKVFQKVSQMLSEEGTDPVIESFFAVRIVSYVRHCFLQMRNCLIAGLVCGVFTLIALTSYAFEPKQFFSLALWTVLVAAVVLTMWIFVQMDRNAALSAIGGSEPGKVTFDRVFLSSVFAYGVIPLASVVATQFPDLSTYLFRWINPVLRVAGIE